MNTSLSKSLLPPVLDFEASSLSDGSYPITVGLVVQGKLYYWVIKPEPDWVDWSLASQAIHGIKRSYLVENGVAASQVYKEMKAILADLPCIYSDNPYWEKRWLRCLGLFDLEILDIRELVPISARADWQACVERQFKTNNLVRHRADHDAYALALAAHTLKENL